MAVILKNNATSRLASSITASATSLSVSAGEGARFPTLTAGNWFPVTVIDSAGNIEVMRCTARSTDVLTVTRGQEGTTARAFTAGDRIELRMTAGALAEFIQLSTLSADIQAFLAAANDAAARTELGLGDAATKTVQSSALDETAGRLMAVGAFGLGDSGAAANNTDANNITRSGFYFMNGNAPNLPLVANGCLIVAGGESNGRCGQMFFSFASTGFFYRSKTAASTWSAWFRSYSTANMLDIGASAATARAALALGTVATSDVTASSADGTAGRIPKNGDKQVCTAWVNFNGTGTIAIRDSWNVSSLVDNGVGNFQANFTIAMSNTNYSVTATGSNLSTTSYNSLFVNQSSPPTVSSVGIFSSAQSAGNPVGFDPVHVNIQVFGGK